MNNAAIFSALIVKSVGGFYYVEAPEGVFPCKARGIFRKRNQSPLVGDHVTVELPENAAEGMITAIAKRKNSLTRPPVANLDLLFLVTSVCEPVPNLTILDKLIAIAEHKAIEPVLVVTKTDMADASSLIKLYRNAGYTVVEADNRTGAGAAEVAAIISGKVCAFTGNSGVGKSSLLNNLSPGLALKTADISQKLGRGRHTTRHVELFKLHGGYCADTPGFSALDTERYEYIRKEELAACFRDIERHTGDCRFSDCSHTKEKGCSVLAALESGAIAPSRHQSYLAMYEESAAIKDWEVRE